MASKANDGMPPFGHRMHLRVFIDPDLLQCDSVNEDVWATAGMWNHVFGIEPHKLVEGHEEAVIDLRRR